jgi:hypothetical protein
VPGTGSQARGLDSERGSHAHDTRTALSQASVLRPRTAPCNVESRGGGPARASPSGPLVRRDVVVGVPFHGHAGGAGAGDGGLRR